MRVWDACHFAEQANSYALQAGSDFSLEGRIAGSATKLASVEEVVRPSVLSLAWSVLFRSSREFLRTEPRS